jgi:hypothetical protein
MNETEDRGPDVDFLQVVAAPDWWREAVDALLWVPYRSGGRVIWYLKEGSCPRCLHPDGIRVTKEALTYRLLPARPPPAETWVSCVCRYDHPHRPDGETGCGYGALVAAPLAVANND